MDDRPTSKRRLSLVSLVEADGTLVETIFKPEGRETAFVIARNGRIEIRDSWEDGGVAYVPVRPTNNLLKHRALLLPAGPLDFGDVQKLQGDIRSYIRRYVLLSGDALDLAASYVLLTWVYDSFNELPYLRFRGDYGTGKSRALVVVGSICYKAFFASGASTVSPIFHTLDTFKGTLIFDEADFRFSDEKSDLVKILNNGNTQGFPVLRTQVTPQKEFDPRAFSIFGPKIVGMRRTYDDRALESRFLTITMFPDRITDVPINLPTTQADEALELRNKLLLYRLQCRRGMHLDARLASTELEPRLNQILLPLLSVAPVTAHSAIRSMGTCLQQNLVSDRTESIEGKLLSTIRQLLVDPSASALSLANITAKFAVEHGSEFDRKITNRWVGSVVRRLGIALYKSNGVFVMIPGQQKLLNMLFTRFGLGTLDRP